MISSDTKRNLQLCHVYLFMVVTTRVVGGLEAFYYYLYISAEAEVGVSHLLRHFTPACLAPTKCMSRFIFKHLFLLLFRVLAGVAQVELRVRLH